MKRMMVFLAAVVFLLAVKPWVSAIEPGPVLNSLKKVTNEKILQWAKNPIVVNAVREANTKATKSADEITQLDKKWRATEGVDEWIGAFINNPCANYLRDLQKTREGMLVMFSEIFVMDRQGCIVAESNKTSDYWQGDEDKFVKSFADGKGSIFIDEPTFDQSSRKYTSQVSVPVRDPDTGAAIGAITVGVDLDAMGQQAIE